MAKNQWVLLAKVKTNFESAAHFYTFLQHCLHNYNMKVPSYTSYGGNVMCVPVSFSFNAPHFILVVTSTSHILTAAILKFSRFSSNKNRTYPATAEAWIAGPAKSKSTSPVQCT